MKTAPKFKGRRVDNGEWVEGWLIELVYEKYIVLERTANPSEFSHKTLCGQPMYLIDPTTVEQIGGDLVEKNAELKRQIAEGELIPVGAIAAIIKEFHAVDNVLRSFEPFCKARIKQFAKERQGGNR